MVWAFALWFMLAVSTPWDSEAVANYEDWPYIWTQHDYRIQSPVNIITKTVVRRYLPFLHTEGYWFFDEAEVKITNTGHTVCVTFPEHVDQPVPYIMGGPLLKKKYEFAQMHFHWGEHQFGSEHEINGLKYAMEVHMVHFKSDYGSFDIAKNKEDGLCVLTFLGQLTINDNPQLKNFTDDLKYITRPNSSIARGFRDEFSWLKNSALRQHYFTYHGSLTTPLYNECVIWIILTKPIGISMSQLDKFRQLSSNQEGTNFITKNDREIQPTNNRTILYAF